LDDQYAEVFASDLEGIFFQATASDLAVQGDQQRFESGARETTRNYWDQVQENAVQEGSFAKYLFGGVMGQLGAAGHSIGETAAAMWNDPGSAAIGAGKGLVNLPTDLVDGAVNLTKMSMDGWTYIAEDITHDYFGVEKGFFDDFRETDVYNFGHILDYNNQAEQGGGIFAQIVAPAAVGKLAELKYASESTVGTQPNRIYSARELVRRAEEPGPFHNFPEAYNAEIFSGNRTVINDNYVLYTKEGKITLPGEPIYGKTQIKYGDALNNPSGQLIREIIDHTPARVIEGRYEIGVRPSASGRTEVITHRFFRPSE
jgi:hypothetical protein